MPFNVIFFPFLYIFLTKVAFSTVTGVARAALIGIFILANLGSIPFFERFAEQPYSLKIQDGISLYVDMPK